MRRPSRIPLPTPAMVVAIIALLVAVGGTAGALGVVGPNTVRSQEVVNNSLRGVDIRQGTISGADIATRAVGRSELSNAVRAEFAQVTANGTIGRRSSGVLANLTHTPGSNEYLVRFNRDIRNCAWLANTSNEDPFSRNIQSFAEVTRNGSSTQLIVRTYRPAGFAEPVARPFHLGVLCSE